MTQNTASTTLRDETWNEFVASTHGGHRAQTTQWGDLKSAFGWEVERLTVESSGRVVAAAQLLTRSVAPMAAVGYVQKGPLLATSDPGVRAEILQKVEAAARARKVRYLAIQPPDTDRAATPAMTGGGWDLLDARIWPTATTAVDLRSDTDALFEAMKSKTRYNIRKAAKNEVVVRKGGREDLPVFHRFASNTSERQDFGLPSLDYFETAWELFSDDHHEIAVFVAEHEGKPVSAILTLGYRKTLTYWRGGWSGESGSAHPNEAIHWHVMQWAKEKGYESYDFDGVERRLAEAVANDEERPADLPRSVSDFKLGFGGNVHVFPEPVFRIPNPVLRYSYPLIARVLETPAFGGRFQLTV